MQKQYIDLPLTLEDTPYNILQKIQPFRLPKAAEDTAAQFLQRIQRAIKENKQQQLYILCTTYFHQADTQKFNNVDWPSASKLQQIKQRDYTIPAQNVYQEITLRKKFDRAKSNQHQFLSIASDCWETYTSIFEHQCNKVRYPTLLIWDFFENFAYQFSQYHFRIQTINPEKIKSEWFGYKQTMEFLKALEKHIDSKPSLPSLQYFGYFSLIIRATIETYMGNFNSSISIISKIGSYNLNIFGKAMGSYLTLFLTPAYCYFQLGDYNKSARLCQIVALFFQKNRKYIPKITDRHLIRQHQRIVGMLSIVYIFLEQKPKNNIMEIFKMTAIKTKGQQFRQKISDRYNKMKQNDSAVFMKLFNYSSLPLIGPKTNVDERQKEISSRFDKLSQLTFNTIIHNYKQIPIKKLAAYLKCDQSEALKKIEQYSSIQRGTSPWDSTIMFHLLQAKRKISLNVITTEPNQQKILKIDVDMGDKTQGKKDWQQYRQQISWLIQKVQAI